MVNDEQGRVIGGVAGRIAAPFVERRIAKGIKMELNPEETAALERELARIMAQNPQRIDERAARLRYAQRLQAANDLMQHRGQAAYEIRNSVDRTHAIARILGNALRDAGHNSQ
jgi:hypothetical protein